jgi:hypothetical protein
MTADVMLILKVIYTFGKMFVVIQYLTESRIICSCFISINKYIIQETESHAKEKITTA